MFFRANGEMKHDASDEDSDEENEEGDYTVYECPGLAPVRQNFLTAESISLIQLMILIWYNDQMILI